MLKMRQTFVSYMDTLGKRRRVPRLMLREIQAGKNLTRERRETMRIIAIILLILAATGSLASTIHVKQRKEEEEECTGTKQ